MLVRTYIDKNIHERVKKFAFNKRMTLQFSYKYLINKILDEDGNERDIIVVEDARSENNLSR
jgi:hypothetical protein